MHLTEDNALNLLEGRAQEPELTLWTSHVEGCTDCHEQLNFWREMLVNLNRSHLESAPEPLIRNAEAIFQAARARLPKLRELREVLASLVFDSFSQPALAGARGASLGSSTSSARQIVLRAEEFDIHVRIWGGQEQRRITGQVLARGESAFIGGANLHLMRDGERCGSASVDNFGEFEFPVVPEGMLNIQVDLPHLTIVGALIVT
jgi:hypothetical protein